MSQTQQFVHVALSNPKRQFRVIEILPSSRTEKVGGAIECIVSTLDLTTDKGHYKALSYLWGPPEPAHTIHVNGREFEVRENLWHFLRQAQTRSAHNPLFVDAICIDQINVPERNRQVQIMGDIYEHAELVLSWLGHDNSSVEPALPFIRSITNKTLSELEHYYDGQDRREHQQAWSCVYQLCNLRYWTRVWIVQEIIKPKDIVLLYGDHQLPWSRLAHFFSILAQAEPSPAPLPELLQNSKPNEFVRTRSDSATSAIALTMRDVLLRYADSACSEPRDRVFALLSLAATGYRIKVDYTRSLCELFMDVVRLWGTPYWSNILVLAKHMADALLSPPATIAGHESQPKDFVLKVVEVDKVHSSDPCVRVCVCLTAVRIPERSSCLSVQNGKPLADGEIVARHFPGSRPIRLDQIRHSELQCSDMIYQIEDTSMFLVGRASGVAIDIVARLAITIDEVDGKSLIAGQWLPWPKSLVESCPLVHRGNKQYQLSFNAFTLRTFLVLVDCVHIPLHIKGLRDAPYQIDIECIKWNGEPQGSYTISAVDQVQSYCLEHRQVESQSNDNEHKLDSVESTTDYSMTLGQAHQALRSGKVDLYHPQELIPTPSWRDLLGR